MLHSYNLYSALIHENPRLKTERWQLKPITGRYRHHWIELTRDSHFAIRCDLSVLKWLNIPSLLRVERTHIEVGEMEGRSLSPCPDLYSPIVVIKQDLASDEKYSRDCFLVSLGKQLQQIGVNALPTVGHEKRYINVRGRSIIGFSVRFNEIKEVCSLRLQQHGLGGKQRMGCGGFWNG